jgi:hypothetical protein
LNVDWGRVGKALVAFAVRRMHLRPPEAQDMAQRAMQRAFDPDYAAWDPAAEPNILIHLFGVMRGMAGSDRQRHGFEAERLTRSGELPRVAVAARTDDVLADAQEARDAFAALRALARGDGLVERILEANARGLDTPAELARALDVNATDIYSANKRLDRYVLAVKASREGH